MSTPTTESSISELEKDRDGLLESLKVHSGAFQRLESKVNVLDSKVNVLDSKVDKIVDDVAWIRKKLS